MDDLVEEYLASLKQIRQAIRNIRQDQGESEEAQVKISLLRGMERDLLWSIEWMRTGREPANRRGVERLAGYQREYLVNPFLLDSQYPTFSHPPSNRLTRSKISQLKQIFTSLSRGEKNVYMMSRGNGLSYQEIALILHVKKGTVQKLIERAEKKIKDTRKIMSQHRL